MSFPDSCRKGPGFFSSKLKSLWISTKLSYDSLKLQETQDKQEISFTMKDDETSKIMNEMEKLKEEFKIKDSALERIEMEKLELSEKLKESEDEVKCVAKERDDLQRLQEALQSERDQLRENAQEIRAKVSFHLTFCK